MSDDEYEYDYGSDAEEENYGSDGGEDGENNGATEELIEIENAFYGMQNALISSPIEECVRHLPPCLLP
jgi:hypothetical protein